MIRIFALSAIVLGFQFSFATVAQTAAELAPQTAAETTTGDVPEQVAEELQKIYSPWIEGDVLHIKGRIDSHIYDFLSFEAKALEKVRVIELNSLGGSTNWGLEVANKIKSLGKDTRLTSGHYCASACTYLFAAGKERIASTDVWFGVHGARLGAGYMTNFWGLCFIELEDGAVFEPKKKGCQEFLASWYETAMKVTLEAFHFMESNGVSSSLRETYFAMPDDPSWPGYANVIRKPDWVLGTAEARKFNLVTKTTGN